MSFKKEYIPVFYRKAGGGPVTGVLVKLKMWA
jgi:site-specific recombinase